MTRIGIMSDTHGYVELIDQVLAMPEVDDVDIWLHAGDLGSDGRYLQERVDVTVYMVRGNNDRGSHLEAREQLIPLEDTFIYMTHGHQVSYYDGISELIHLGSHMGARLIVSGHTHVHKMEEHGDVTYVNPGSVALPRDCSIGTFALVNYEEGQFTVDFCSL